jgi:glucose-1-phosphate cytidylyltransferase
MRDGEELVEQPFQRLVDAGLLRAYPHNGFFASMDTFKDKQHLDDLYARGAAPWEVWKRPAPANGSPVPASGSLPLPSARRRALRAR